MSSSFGTWLSVFGNKRIMKYRLRYIDMWPVLIGAYRGCNTSFCYECKYGAELGFEMYENIGRSLNEVRYKIIFECETIS